MTREIKKVMYLGLVISLIGCTARKTAVDKVNFFEFSSTHCLNGCEHIIFKIDSKYRFELKLTAVNRMQSCYKGLIKKENRATLTNLLEDARKTELKGQYGKGEDSRIYTFKWLENGNITKQSAVVTGAPSVLKSLKICLLKEIEIIKNEKAFLKECNVKEP